MNKKKIEKLKVNLKIEEHIFEQINPCQKLLIIPLKKDFQTINITQRTTYKFLVIFETTSKDFIQGNVIEVIPKETAFVTIPQNLVSNCLNSVGNEFAGIFSIMTLTTKFIEEKEFDSGRLQSIKYLSDRDKNSVEKDSTSKKVSGCISWYLVTTYYYEDGSRDQTWEFLYMSCSDECNSARLLESDIKFKQNCGGGGDGSNEEVINTQEEGMDVDYEIAEVDEDLSGVAPLVKYNYIFHFSRTNTGRMTNIILDPTTVESVQDNYIDLYGRNTTRYLRLFGHLNFWFPLTTNDYYLSWFCFVNFRWVYQGSTSPNYTRTISNYHAKVAW